MVSVRGSKYVRNMQEGPLCGINERLQICKDLARGPLMWYYRGAPNMSGTSKRAPYVVLVRGSKYVRN